MSVKHEEPRQHWKAADGHRPTQARKAIAIALAAAITGAPGLANAQANLQPDLIASLKQVSAGQCPARMAPLLQQSCAQSIKTLGAIVASHGAVTSVTYRGTQIAQGTQLPASVYSVQFANGAMTWMIAEDKLGQLTVFWTPG